MRPPGATTPYDADEQGWFGGPAGFGGRFMPEALVAALDELTVAWQEAMADPAFVGEFDAILRDYAGMPSPLYYAERLSEGRRPDPAQARGPQPHRRPQDPQRARPGAAHQADGQDPGDRRDRGRPARRRQRDRRGVLRPRLHRLHGLGRHQAPGAQRRPDAAARREGRPGRLRQRHPQGRDQRGAARLGRQRRPHPLPLRHRRRPAPVPERWCATSPAASATRPAPSAWSCTAGCRTRSSPASAAAPTRSASSPRSSTTPTSRSTASRPGATASRPAGTPRRSRRRARACCTAPARSSSRTRTARPSSRTRSRPGSTTRASARSTPGWPTTGRATYLPVTDAEAMDAMALLSRTEGIIPAIESAHALAGALRLAEERPGPDDPGQPLRARRQGHGHRDRVLRPRASADAETGDVR